MNIHAIIKSDLRNIRNIKRYSSSSVHHSENVAEHSYWVAYFSLLIGEELLNKGVKVDMHKLLSKAILHDLAEGLTGDVIHTFKHHNENMKRVTNETEEILFKETLEKEFDSETAKDLFDTAVNAKKDFEGKIISLADAICVFAYGYDEIQMGNRSILKTLGGSIEKFKTKDFGPELQDYKEQIISFGEEYVK